MLVYDGGFDLSVAARLLSAWFPCTSTGVELAKAGLQRTTVLATDDRYLEFLITAG